MSKLFVVLLCLLSLVVGLYPPYPNTTSITHTQTSTLSSTSSPSHSSIPTQQTFHLYATGFFGHGLTIDDVAANDGAFWLGKPTRTYCPVQLSLCPTPTNTTVFIHDSQRQTLSMNVEVPAGQSVYVDPNDGHLAFSEAHVISPQNGTFTPFTLLFPSTSPTILGEFVIPGMSTACPEAGFYKIYSLNLYKGSLNVSDCYEIQLWAIPNAALAWEYI